MRGILDIGIEITEVSYESILYRYQAGDCVNIEEGHSKYSEYCHGHSMVRYGKLELRKTFDKRLTDARRMSRTPDSALLPNQARS